MFLLYRARLVLLLQPSHLYLQSAELTVGAAPTQSGGYYWCVSWPSGRGLAVEVSSITPGLCSVNTPQPEAGALRGCLERGWGRFALLIRAGWAAEGWSSSLWPASSATEQQPQLRYQRHRLQPSLPSQLHAVTAGSCQHNHTLPFSFCVYTTGLIPNSFCIGSFFFWACWFIQLTKTHFLTYTNLYFWRLGFICPSCVSSLYASISKQWSWMELHLFTLLVYITFKTIEWTYLTGNCVTQ